MADKIITLKNEVLTVDISTKGAEIQKIEKDGVNYLWSGDPAVWACKAPILYPICGGLRDDKFTYDGKEYTMPKHGFAKLSEFSVEASSDTGAVFKYEGNETHDKNFPFCHEFRVKYFLEGKSLKVTYHVTNKDNKTMYFSVGAHEGYATRGGIEDYSIVFDKEETLDSYILDGNLLEHNTLRIMENSKVLPLKYDFFKVDAIVFKHINSRKVTLKHNNSDYALSVEFPGHDFFVLWTKPGAEYICIEPWCGVQDPVDSDYNIINKEGIVSLDAGKVFEATHIITVEN